MRNYILFIAFGLMVLFQWLVPSVMIWNRENIIRQNQVYLFETKPVDPHDAFRGKYVVLGFRDNKVQAYGFDSIPSFRVGQEAFVTVDRYAGIAYLSEISEQEPTERANYFKTKVLHVDEYGQITVDFPFNRYYMNEEKSLRAEQILNDENLKAYAQVAIYKGEVVLKDVLVEGVSLKDFVETYRGATTDASEEEPEIITQPMEEPSQAEEIIIETINEPNGDN
ncbi:GDYXXLXY domain-containing protein [Capnocytophaga canis]|uniref:GDYXXLXY domain-containing protein n=1 Tax=Capnocytophaga canis TaxID=1848903 RepID=UPI0037D54006